MRKVWFYLLVLTSIFLIPKARGQDNLTPEQLILLMRASSEQYRFISSRIKYTFSEQNSPEGRKELKVTHETISRWARENNYHKTIRTVYNYQSSDKPSSRTEIYTYSIGPSRSKKLHEIQGSKGPPRGIIEAGRDFADEIWTPTPYDAMWSMGLTNFKFDYYINPDFTTTTFDERTGFYIMTAKRDNNPDSSFLRLYIDPQKDYIPIKQEIVTSAGILWSRQECTNFKKTLDGLWIPYEYSWFSPEFNSNGRCLVEEITVNEPIADTLFDFEFPEGAIVTDNRIGAKYKVTKAAGQTVASVPTEPNAVIKLPQPATDEKLRSIAGKAWQLAAAGAAEKQALKIEVFPQYVYVKPDKTQYLLTIKTNNDIKPQLLDFSFESDKMNLASLENQIYEKSRLIVNVQRQQEEKGFQKAILSLQFADEKINVVFVSPPLKIN